MTITVPQGTEVRADTGRPQLPPPRGELSEAVHAYLRGVGRSLPDRRSTVGADPYAEDLQLALHLAYELHYRGFDQVPDAVEWDPDLLRLRSLMEERFEDALRDRCGRFTDVDEAFAALLTEPAEGHGVSDHLVRDGTREQLREYAALRSVYQLREADPHLWVVPRLRGRAKAAMVAIEYDEFGCGRAEAMHARLFADLMSDLGLDPSYGRYLEAAGAQTLATVNLMSLLGLHRARRGALVGHFAALEITSSPAAARISAAMRRIGAGEAAVHFYDEHVEADAVHEQLVRREVVGGLLADEPELAGDVVFGVEATGLLEDDLAAHITGAWEAGRSALRVPIDDLSGAGRDETGQRGDA
ncbi:MULTISPECIES: iron-containing redox enzyme family protein [unclassified Streptomyces]|uniref:iron-containing redox enzyme family protein n=1 Tax=unclassified Streptomyces TaxID=2593676 RepID=UPI0036BD64D5